MWRVARSSRLAMARYSGARIGSTFRGRAGLDTEELLHLGFKCRQSVLDSGGCGFRRPEIGHDGVTEGVPVFGGHAGLSQLVDHLAGTTAQRRLSVFSHTADVTYEGFDGAVQKSTREAA
jgi:hypothetical protein